MELRPREDPDEFIAKFIRRARRLGRCCDKYLGWDRRVICGGKVGGKRVRRYVSGGLGGRLLLLSSGGSGRGGVRRQERGIKLACVFKCAGDILRQSFLRNFIGTCERCSKGSQRIHTCFALGSSASRFAFASRRWSLAWPFSFFVLWNTSSRFCLFFIALDSNLCSLGIAAEVRGGNEFPRRAGAPITLCLTPALPPHLRSPSCSTSVLGHCSLVYFFSSLLLMLSTSTSTRMRSGASSRNCPRTL